MKKRAFPEIYYLTKNKYMKKLILILVLIINTNVFAQRQGAFFYSDSAGIKNIVSLIMENTKNKYHLDKVFNRKQNVEFWYRYDPHTLLRIHFQIFPDTSARLFILKTLTGNYEDIFPFWKKYFQENADSATIKKERFAKSAAIPFLKREIVYSFLGVGSSWQIKPYSLVDPNKK